MFTVTSYIPFVVMVSTVPEISSLCDNASTPLVRIL